MMDGVMKQYLRPLHQKHAGLSVDKIICIEGKHLMFKHHDSSPACVNFGTVEKLALRGWQAEKPVMACTMQYNPVCGIDGMTYGNMCGLNSQHMALKHRGECTASETRILYVDSTLSDCVGVGPQKCMLTRESLNSDWQLFYDSIDGFDYQEGTQYKLNVMVTSVENPPADGSSLEYSLIEILDSSSTSSANEYDPLHPDVDELSIDRLVTDTEDAEQHGMKVTVRPVYDEKTVIMVLGHAEGFSGNNPSVTVQVFDEDGNRIASKATSLPNNDGAFGTFVYTEEQIWDDGNYTVKVTHKGQDIMQTSFDYVAESFVKHYDVYNMSNSHSTILAIDTDKGTYSGNDEILVFGLTNKILEGYSVVSFQITDKDDSIVAETQLDYPGSGGLFSAIIPVDRSVLTTGKYVVSATYSDGLAQASFDYVG